MANEYARICSRALAIRDMQIKVTVKYHYVAIRVAKRKNSGNTKCWQGWGETGSPIHYWGEYKILQPLWRIVQQFLVKCTMQLSYKPATVLLGIYSRQLKTYVQKSIPECLLQLY